MPWIATFRAPPWWMLGGIPPSITVWGVITCPIYLPCTVAQGQLSIQHHIQLTSLSFQVSPPSHSWDTAISKFYLENQRSRPWCKRWNSQHGSNILSTHIPLVPSQSTIPFLRCNFFKIWLWKSKVKVMVEVKVESHKVGVTSYWLTSLPFRVNRPFHSWDTTFFKFDLENPRWGSNDNDVAQLQV